MKCENGNNGVLQSLTGKEFNLLRNFIQEKLGIKMPDSKKVVLEARLQKRLRITRIKELSVYCQFLFSEEGESELISFVDAVTTHKTFFFREPEQFDFLCGTSLTGLYPNGCQQPGKALSIWSAGCSSGEEPYSIAIQLEEFKESQPAYNLDYSILATDVSIKAVEKARLAVYNQAELEGVSQDKILKYFLKSRNSNNKIKKVVPEIRQHLKFEVLNLNSSFQFNKKLDVIFCRNVMIYFDDFTKTRVVNGFANSLTKGGYLFIGSSESLRKINNRLKPVGPSVYQYQ